MASEETLHHRDIVDDLVLILSTVESQYQGTGSASYESIRGAISARLRLGLRSYIHFLEGQTLLIYDRINDTMRITDGGRRAKQSAEQLKGPVTKAFAEYLSDEREVEEVHSLSNLFDDIEVDVDVGTGLQGLQFDSDPTVDREIAIPPDQSAPASGVQLFGEREFSINDEMDEPISTRKPLARAAQGSSMGEEKGFERIEELGSGGIGTVYRGRQLRLNREVAIKEIREIFNVFAGVEREDILDRFRTIMQTQASLLHPNIIQLIDIDTTGEYPIAVMQLATRGNLRRVIEHGERPPLDVAIKYFLQILHALHAAHGKGVIHGSLKPENVVLDQAGNAMVTDFGISRIVERGGNQVYVGVGSVAYMSPEQFQNPNLASVKSDIYSLGIMFYEMLTGKVPGRRSPMPSNFFPDIPQALDDIFDRMSMDHEEDRYDSVDEVIADIYESEDILEILDKRSGVLFLHDPIGPGITGVEAGHEVEQPVVESPEESLRDEGDSAIIESSPEEDSESEESENIEVAEEVVEDDEVEIKSDVLDKLNKYGELFEED